MNRVHPLYLHKIRSEDNDDNIQPYTDDPPPYTPYVVQAEILNSYICRVQINGDIIKIKVIKRYKVLRERSFLLVPPCCI